MRSVLSISLPPTKKYELEAHAKKARKTTSAYILDIFELVKRLIPEDEIAKMSKKAEKDYKAGKTKKLKSLADLMKP